jgi:hypothetical protein
MPGLSSRLYSSYYDGVKYVSVINIEIILKTDDHDLQSIGDVVEDRRFPEEPFYSIAQISNVK